MKLKEDCTEGLLSKAACMKWVLEVGGGRPLRGKLLNRVAL